MKDIAPPRYPEHHWSADLFLRTWGAPEGVPLVWLHGLGESGLCFEPVTRHPHLETFCHHIPDLWGYGRSPWPANPESLETIAQRLHRWLGTFAKPPVVLGHSMGGVLGILIGELEPMRMLAFINIDGNLSLGDCTYSAQAIAMGEASFRNGGFDRLRAWVLEAGDRASQGYYASMRLADEGSFFRHSEDLVRLSQTEELAVRMAALKPPQLYVAGMPGGVAERSRMLLDANGIAWKGIEPSGHWPFIDPPDLFVETVEAFLNDLR